MSAATRPRTACRASVACFISTLPSGLPGAQRLRKPVRGTDSAAETRKGLAATESCVFHLAAKGPRWAQPEDCFTLRIALQSRLGREPRTFREVSQGRLIVILCYAHNDCISTGKTTANTRLFRQGTQEQSVVPLFPPPQEPPMCPRRVPIGSSWNIGLSSPSGRFCTWRWPLMMEKRHRQRR